MTLASESTGIPGLGVRPAWDCDHSGSRRAGPARRVPVILPSLGVHLGGRRARAPGRPEVRRAYHLGPGPRPAQVAYSGRHDARSRPLTPGLDSESEP